MIADTSLEDTSGKSGSGKGPRSLDFEAGLTNQFSCTARRQKPDVVLDQALRKIKKSSLVEDRENGYVNVNVS